VVARALLATALALACACGKSDGGATADLVGAWQQAGLDPTSFQPIDAKALGGTCRAGKVKGVDATVCEFEDADKAKRAEAAGLAQVGDATGASIAQGKLLLVLADRSKADPSGKNIKEIAKVFRNR
jgi:hypothetical protein